jgi:hypothetical protein
LAHFYKFGRIFNGNENGIDLLYILEKPTLIISQGFGGGAPNKVMSSVVGQV